MTSSRGRYSSGEQTRTRLVEAAERLFARRGYDGVTLADIRKAAGQYNSSVIGYYFGTKEGLLLAVFSHRLPSVNAERDALLAEMRRTKDALSVRDTLWVITRPLANTIGRNSHYVTLLDQLAHRDRLTEYFHAAEPAATESGREIDGALRLLLSDLPEDVVQQRLDLVYSGMVRTLARYDRCGRPPTRSELSGLVDAWEAMLVVPLSQETEEARGSASDTGRASALDTGRAEG